MDTRLREEVLGLLSRRMGLDSSTLGEKTVSRAVAGRMRELEIRDGSDYLDLLRASNAEVAELVEAVVVPETWFFRDAGPFDCLGSLAGKRAADRPFRVLSSPCSTGEEPYSAAMALLHAGLAPSDFRITAADISARALETARRGIYPPSSFRTVGPDDPRARFVKHGDAFEVAPEVRESVDFVQANMVEPGFLRHEKPFDAVFCKNLAIYLDEKARARLTGNVRRLAAEHGLVFTGHTETFIFQRAGFSPVSFERAFACTPRPPSGQPRPTPGPAKAVPRTPPPPPAARAPRQTEKPAPRSPEAAARPSATLEDVRKAADRGELSRAKELCRAYLDKNASDAEAQFLMGLVEQALGRNERAEKRFRKALYLDPSHYAALVNLSLICEQKGEVDRAETFRRRAGRAGREAEGGGEA